MQDWKGISGPIHSFIKNVKNLQYGTSAKPTTSKSECSTVSKLRILDSWHSLVGWQRTIGIIEKVFVIFNDTSSLFTLIQVNKKLN